MKVLIVCTGNTCRSPMAEGILKSMAKDRGDINALSGGVFAADGGRASENAVLALADMGIDISGHISHSLNDDVIAEADLILTMTHAQAEAVVKMYADAVGKTYTLCEYAGVQGEILDPYGQDLDAYKRCAKNIFDVLALVYKRIQGREE